MTGFASFVAVVLAGVFAMAAQLKLRAPSRTADEFASLGLPQSRVLAWAVPGVELAVAVGLLLRPGWAATVAFAMLAAFTTVLVGVVRSGRVVSCACFGGSSPDPVGRHHLFRNVVLMLMALPVLGIDQLERPSLRESLVAMATVLLAALAVRAARR